MSSEKFRELLVGEHAEMLESSMFRKGMEAPRPFPHTFPYAFFHLAVPELYLFIIKQ